MQRYDDIFIRLYKKIWKRYDDIMISDHIKTRERWGWNDDIRLSHEKDLVISGDVKMMWWYDVIR